MSAPPEAQGPEANSNHVGNGAEAVSFDQQVPNITDTAFPSTLVKSETATFNRDAIRDAIPAFVPVASIKREAITPIIVEPHDGSIPISTTEEASVSESRGTKRPAPKSKKGVAKKGPPAKKQKTGQELAKPRTKQKSNLKRPISASGTPLGSSPAPLSARGASSAGRSSATPDYEDEDEDDDDAEGSPGADTQLYCICRRPDTGTFMIACDSKCQDWFHGKCVGITEKDQALIDHYACASCTEKGHGVTTWKRMCRRPDCGLPARVGKKNDEKLSKYCSDECGVLFFKEMLARTRDANDADHSRRGSRKSTGTGPKTNAIDDLGPRGGVIRKSELKTLVKSANSFDNFKLLGEGVLSPPATPSPESNKKQDPHDQDLTHLDDHQAKRLAEIGEKKDRLRARHALLKDQAKLINMLHAAGTRAAEAKGLKPRDVCGFDERARMDEVSFQAWRNSPEGQTAFQNNTIELSPASLDAADNAELGGPCMKKKCPKHYDWSKLALDTNRAENAENSEVMRALDREEKDIKERAGLKARQVLAGDGGGEVEMHDVDMEVEKVETLEEPAPVPLGAAEESVTNGVAAEPGAVEA